MVQNSEGCVVGRVKMDSATCFQEYITDHKQQPTESSHGGIIIFPVFGYTYVTCICAAY